jgi:hypothetical protein
MTTTKTTSGHVTIKARSIDDELPLQISLKGKRELLEDAFRQKQVRIEIFGLKFQTEVLGHNPATDSLLVASESFFRALARGARAQRSRIVQSVQSELRAALRRPRAVSSRDHPGAASDEP